jgi:murein tripeptide amidase MpaA
LLLVGFSALAHAQQVPEKWLTGYEKSGYKKTPRYKETMEYCRLLEQGSPWIRVTKFGTSPEGRDMPLVIASKDKIFDAKGAAKSDKAILLIQNGIHAGEIDGKDACLMLLRDIAITKSKASLLDHVILLVIPIYNVDGHERFGPNNRINQNGPEEMGWRVNALNLNLNRDYLKADAPETQAWLKLFNAWLPDFFIDCHVTDGADFQYSVTYGIELHENVAPPVRSWIQQQYLPMLSALRLDGVPVAPYIFLRDALDPLKGQDGGGVAPPRFSTAYVPLQNRPGLLIETHMLKEYKTRVDGTYGLLEATLRRMNEEYVSLRNAVRLADKEVAKGIHEAYAVRYDQVDTPSDTISYLGFRQQNGPSEISGTTGIRYTREPFEAHVPRYDSVRATTLIRPPAAYLIPAQWKDVAERLKMHGLQLERLTAATTVDVEEYRFSNASWAQSPFEGRHAASYRVDTIQRRRTFPAGTIVCPMRQRAAKVALHALEPQAPDAFAAWGFFDAVFEQKEYAEDYVMESMAPAMLSADSALARQFREKLRTDSLFAKSPGARINFFYQHSPYWDDAVNLYPVARLMREQVLPTEPLR